MTTRCKECGKGLPKGNSPISRTARELGYCRYCYRMNVTGEYGQPRRIRLGDEDIPEVDPIRGAEVFDPAEPWNWYEYYFPENER